MTFKLAKLKISELVTRIASRSATLYRQIPEKLEPVLLKMYWLRLLGGLAVSIFWLLVLPSAGKAIGVLGSEEETEHG